MNKTILRAALAVFVLLLFCGAAVGAESISVTTEEGLTTAVEGDNFDVILDADIPLSASLTIEKTGKIDLNGHVLSRGSSKGDFSVITVSSSGNLTVADSSSGKYHYFKVQDAGKPWTLDDNQTTGTPLDQITDAAQLVKDQVIKVTGGCITGGSGTQTDTWEHHRSGGGVWVNGGTFTLSGGNIIGNSAYFSGGGVRVDNGPFTMSGGSIAGNCADSPGRNEGYGGGLCFNSSGKSFTMTNGLIVGNYAKMNGGGVSVDAGTFTMSGSAGIVGNNAYSSGGVMFQGGGTFTMSENAGIKGNNATITNNVGSGGVYVYGGTFTMNNGSITGNTIAHDGGGVFVTNSGTFNLNGGEITNNTAAHHGGGVCAWVGTFTMTGGEIKGNKVTETSSGGYGGGVYVNGACPFQMNGGTISGNEAKYGGGVSVGGSSTGTIEFTMTNGEIKTNIATEGGGVFVASNGRFLLCDTPVIMDNTRSDKTTANNVYLTGNSLLQLTNDLKSPAEIHITYANAPPTEGGKFGTAVNQSLAGADRFIADVAEGADHLVGNINSSVELVWVKGEMPGGWKVTYNGNENTSGNVPVDSTIYSSGATVTVLGNTGGLTKEEEEGGKKYDFSGWTRGAPDTGFVYRKGDTLTITENTTLYAKWTEIPASAVNITFNANGGSGTMSVQHAAQGEWVSLSPNEFTAPVDPTRNCLVFAGWTKTEGGTSIEYRNCQFVSFTEDTTLYAVWKTEHSIVNIPHVNPTCTAAGHTVGEECSVCHTHIIEPTELPAAGHTMGAPVRENYKEATQDKDGSYERVVYCTVCSKEIERTTVTIPAGTPVSWTVTYYGNGADKGAAPVDDTLYTTGSSTATVQGKGTMLKTGYDTFDGWTLSPDGTGTVYEEGATITITKDTILYAKWIPNTYTVHFEAAGGTGTMEDQTFTYGDDEMLWANEFTRAGYVFAGWTPNPDMGVKYENYANILNLSAVNGATVTIYAVWNPLKQVELVKEIETEASGITIITKTDDGTISINGNTAEITINDTAIGNTTKVTIRYTGTPTLSEDGKKVSGEIIDFDIITYGVLPPTESQTTEERATAEIECHLQNIADIELLKRSPEINAGVDTAKLIRLSSTYKIGGMFSGRADDVLNNKLRQTGITLTFYLDKNWVEERYGKDLEVIRQSLDVLQIPDDPDEGSVSVDSDVTYENGQYVVRALTYKGISTSYAVTADPIYYDVTFNPNGGKWSEESSDEKTVRVLETLPLAEADRTVPVKDDDTFEYWMTSSGDEYDMSSPVNSDIILYAKWKGGGSTPTLTVTYDGNDDTGAVTGTVPTDRLSPYQAGSEVTVLGNTGGLAKDGFNFSGWTLSADGTGTVYHKGDTFTITRNTTLYAKWTAIPSGSVTITFYANGGQPETYTQHVTPNTSVPLAPNEFTAPADPKCLVFAGWATTLEKAQAGSVDYRNCESATFEADTDLYAVWKTEHSIVNIDRVEPTCTTAGHSIGEKCSVCDAIIIKPETLPATGHNPGNPVKENYTAPTETTAGSYDLVVSCTNCGAELERKHITIPKLTPETRWNVTYYGNGADKGTPPVDSTKYPNEADVTLKNKNTLQKTGYTFGGWKLRKADGSETVLQPGGTFTVTGDTALYAVWNPITYTVRFEKTGGSGTMVDQEFTYGTSKKLPQNTLTRTDYVFAGWAPADNVGVKYEDEATILNLSAVNSNVVTLYAVWNPVTQFELVTSVHQYEDKRTEIITGGDIETDTEDKTATITVGGTTVQIRYTDTPKISEDRKTVTGTINTFDIHYKTTAELPPTESQDTTETATTEIRYDLYNLTDTSFLINTPKITAGVDTEKLIRLSSTYKIGGMFSGTTDDELNNKLRQTGMTLTFYLDKGWVEKRYGNNPEEIREKLDVLQIPDEPVGVSVSIDFTLTYENGQYVVRALTYKGLSTSYAVTADPIYYDVTFNPNGGKWSDGSLGEKTVRVLETLPLSERDRIVPVKDGDTFICWRTESGDEFDPALVVTDNIRLRAEWEHGDPTPAPSHSTPSGSSTWIQTPDTAPGDNTVATDVTYQYAGQKFIPVSAANLGQISTADPAAAAAVEMALQTASAAGIPLTNSKGAKVIVNTTESVPGAQTETFTQIIDVTSADGSKVTSVPFTVRLSDLTVKNLTANDVTLYHYLEEYGIWIPLETWLVSTDSTYAYYEAATDGASPFGVLLKKLDVPEVKPLPTQAGKTPVPFMGVLAALGAAAVVFGLRRK